MPSHVGVLAVLALVAHRMPPAPHKVPELRRRTPVLLEAGENSQEADKPDAAPMSKAEYIRAGGFIDGRPPDDLDKLSTFSFNEMVLPGKILAGVAVSLLLALIVFLIVV